MRCLAPALLLVACRSAEAPPRAVSAEVAPVDAGAPVTVPPAPASSEAPAEAKVPDMPDLQAEGPALGSACTPGRTVETHERVDPCGTKQRVSVVWNDLSTVSVAQAPCKLEPLARRKDGVANIESGCIADGVLYARSHCIMCRLPNAGFSTVARLDELTEPQSTAIQRLLGLPPTGIAGAKAWAKMLATSRGR